MEEPRVRRICGTTRTIRLILEDGGTAVDLTDKTVRVVVSKDDYGENCIYYPTFNISGDGHNVVTFVWTAEQQEQTGDGDYTITVFVDFGGVNIAKRNWHGWDGIRLVRWSNQECGSSSGDLGVDEVIDLEGEISTNGPGESAFEIWAESDYSEGYEKTIDGFMAWMRQPATDAAAAAEAQMVVIQQRADDDHALAAADHTTAGNDHTRAESDHTLAGTDHQTAAADHTLAGNDHTRAESDHTQAGNDHTRAEGDHSTAADDHTRAGADHTQAVSDHGIAADDHTTAQGDHTTATSDHGIAAADHTTAGNDHTQAEADHTLAGTDHTTAAADHQTAAADHTQAESDHTRAEEDHASIADKADVDGYYEQMTVGLAENLVGVNVVPAEYVFRKTPSGTATGLAQIEQIKGKTLVWNQLIAAANISVNTATTGNVGFAKQGDAIILNGTATVNITQTLYKSFIQTNGHKYLCRLVGSDKFYLVSSYHGGFSGQINSNGIIIACTQNGNRQEFSAKIDNGTSFSDVAVRLLIIDLTLLYGSGNEPTTVAEFEADYPLPYYAYNAGTLINNSATGIKTVGFNQWDEEWESGYLNAVGEPAMDLTKIRSANYIAVLPGSSYYIKTPSTYGIRGYDAAKNFTVVIGAPNNIFTVPEGTYYVKFFINNLNTYNHDSCINFSDASKNGTYEPYEEHTLTLNLTTLTGKLNGEGSSVVIAPEGMAGQDGWEDLGIVENGYLTKILKKTPRIEVDLGDLSYTKYSVTEGTLFRSGTVTGIVKAATGTNVVPNLISSKYIAVAQNVRAEKTISRVPDNYTIDIIDSTYSTATSFKTAVAGEKLIFELATPQVYVLDTPIPVAYLVNGNGTEAVIPQGVDANGVPKTTPIVYDVRYALDAKGALTNLPKNFISKESMDNILTAFKTAGIISAYTLTYNTTTGKYDCTITA